MLTTALRVSGHALAVDGASIEVAGATDQGPFRRQNQDVWADAVTRDHAAAVVLLADGMGGERGGLEAASAAVDAAVSTVAAGAADHVVAEVTAASTAAVAAVRAGLGGWPGTTLVLAALSRRSLTVASAGDSRAYLLRGGSLRRLTTDHTLAAAEAAAGRLTEEAARHDARRNSITRAVTGDPVELDTILLVAEPGDVVVLCTDGVWEPLSDAEIARCFPAGGGLAAGVERACREALDAGSRDNVTAVAARISPLTVTN